MAIVQDPQTGMIYDDQNPPSLTPGIAAPPVNIDPIIKEYPKYPELNVRASEQFQAAKAPLLKQPQPVFDANVIPTQPKNINEMRMQPEMGAAFNQQQNFSVPPGSMQSPQQWDEDLSVTPIMQPQVVDNQIQPTGQTRANELRKKIWAAWNF
tara:strand:- start:424 stop:882 length:459 start_codon:yes stop_codon:yes gene_type:complete